MHQAASGRLISCGLSPRLSLSDFPPRVHLQQRQPNLLLMRRTAVNPVDLPAQALDFSVVHDHSMLALCYGRLLENLAGLYRNSDLCAIAANAATTQNENPSKMKPKGTAAFQIANNQQTGRPSVNTRICRWLVPSLLLIFSEMTVAAEAQEKLIRGLWLLTTQAGPIRPDDVQRALRINPSHYASTSAGSPHDATYS